MEPHGEVVSGKDVPLRRLGGSADSGGVARRSKRAGRDASPFGPLLAAEHVWLCRLEAREPRHPIWPALDLDACEMLAGENEAGYQAFLEHLDEVRLGDRVRYRNSQGQEFVTPALDILTQVITHGPYHRGQIAKALARNGATGLNTDFITFARDVEPS